MEEQENKKVGKNRFKKILDVLFGILIGGVLTSLLTGAVSEFTKTLLEYDKIKEERDNFKKYEPIVKYVKKYQDNYDDYNQREKLNMKRICIDMLANKGDYKFKDILSFNPEKDSLEKLNTLFHNINDEVMKTNKSDFSKKGNVIELLKSSKVIDDEVIAILSTKNPAINDKLERLKRNKTDIINSLKKYQEALKLNIPVYIRGNTQNIGLIQEILKSNGFENIHFTEKNDNHGKSFIIRYHSDYKEIISPIDSLLTEKGLILKEEINNNYTLIDIKYAN
ncbi:hypothetical protein [Flammeovirga sp. OC4]|uniref:hypothetical protein n=1 Tax=Flammeovirga sp. OC4 TaxID=1382345 RepID=UPI0005C77DE0|nr:hypothetical protein [Flammeovirga sp. OC4]